MTDADKLEKLQEYRREYYQNNRDKWQKEVECKVCNKILTTVTIHKHNKSKIHKLNEAIKELNDIKKIILKPE